jgi:hypothetical protein
VQTQLVAIDLSNNQLSSYLPQFAPSMIQIHLANNQFM